MQVQREGSRARVTEARVGIGRLATKPGWSHQKAWCLTLVLSGALQALRSGFLLLRVRDEQLIKRLVAN